MPKIPEAGFSHLVVLVLVILGIGIGLFLIQRPAIFKPNANLSSTCSASTPESFKTCLSSAQTSDLIDKIEITEQILCTSKEECSFVLSSRSKPLTIIGAPNTNAGFKRIQNYDYPLLILGDFGRVNQINNITLKDLIFDETTAICDFVKEGAAKCNTPVVLGPKINDSVVDHITILHAKNMGIQVSQATNLTIKNSIVFDSEGDGIWFDSAFTAAGCNIDFYEYIPCDIDVNKISKYITIENNLFVDNKISAIEFYGYADEQRPNLIKGNLITHNHRDSKYKYCPPPNGHCPGGQLAIARSKSVVVDGNVIRDGHINAIDPEKGTTYESQGLFASGIELSDSIQDITIKNNKIYDQKGAALFVDYIGEKYKIRNVNIIWNVVYGNGNGDFVGAGVPNLENITTPGFSFGSNIHDSAYPYKINKAFIFSDPPICTSAGENPLCESVVKWYSNDYSNLTVSIKESPGSLFASAPNGSQAAPWISTAGATFQLLDGSTVLSETKSIKSGPLQNSPSPSASTVVASPSSSGTFTRRAAFRLSANPNPCTLSNSNECSSTISWTYSVVGVQPVGSAWIQIKENPGSKFATLAYGASGSQVAPWIKASGATFQLVENGEVTAELFVKGEVRTPPSPSPSPSGRVGDLDLDGDVDIFDFNLFLQDYKNGNLRSDLNHDGKVDVFDFNILLKNFGI